MSFRVNFVETWNKFMDKLRYDDLISDNEMSLYKCLKLTGFDDIRLEPLLPVRLLAPFCDAILHLKKRRSICQDRLRTNVRKR